MGRGFLAHPANRGLIEKLRAAALDRQDYYRQLLRLVYRWLFLLVAEDRDLLFAPSAGAGARERYTRFHSISRLRRLAERRPGTHHHDLYRGLRLTMSMLGNGGWAELGLPALGSYLFLETATADLNDCELENRHLLEAIRALAFIDDRHGRRPVDFRQLRTDELGGIYESLLELHPEMDAAAGHFDLSPANGNERKTTGSYYTPESLVQCLLDSALDPALDEAAGQPDPEQAILRLKVVDPACGSGHFLIAAAHRMAERLAAIRTGEGEPAPEARRIAVRDVIGQCLYGVDINPMAVELCKVNLWMEALEPGRPLSFLDHRIQCGNSLIGATPALLKGGIPDEAFKAIEGDDQAVCGEYKKLNQRERGGRRRLLAPAPESDYSRLRADAWCAAFVWKKIKDPNHPSPITEEMFRKIEKDPRQLVREGHEEEIRRLADQYRFFHWHLAFPDVFRVPVKDEQPENEQAGWSGGFEVVLGNPPWDQKQFREQEFFYSKRPDFAKAATGEARKQLIKKLETEDPLLFAAYLEARRQSEAVRHFVQSSGRAPLTARGRMNDFALFAETNGLIIRGTGRVGCILPSGIATDDTSKYFFRSLVESESLQSLYDFENRDGLFPEVDSRAKFCLITFSGGAANVHGHADFVFFANSISDLRAAEKRFSLSADEIALLNPNTHTCPIFRSRRDASITKGVYLRVPVLVREGNPDGNVWGIATKPGLFNMTADSARFRTRQTLETRGGTLNGNRFYLGEELYLPLYEGKMFGPYDHRAAHVVVSDSAQLRPGQPEYLTVGEHCSPDTFPLPRYWVHSGDVERQLEGQWTRRWILGWKEVTSSTNERTLIPGIFPRVGIGHKIPVVLLSENCELLAPDLLSCLSSLMCDFIVRQKLGGTSLTPFTFKQLPVFPPFRFALSCPWQPAAQLHQWVTSRVIELIYTASDLRDFVEDCGYGGEPFHWDEARRFLLRCELDAAYFHLYGIDREDADYILETFPIVKRRDEQSSGEYRTKRVILEIYDEMQQAMSAGQPYRTRLDPPPAHGWFPPVIPSR